MEPMLFRRSAGLERLEWSGCKAGESVVVHGQTVPTLGGAEHRKRRLGEAGTLLLPGRRRSLATSETKKANRKCNDGSPARGAQRRAFNACPRAENLSIT